MTRPSKEKLMLKNKNETIMEGLQKKYRLLIIGEMMMIVVGIMIMVGTMMLIGVII